ncbi:MAG: L-threonylcarbamoyladenylate synthase, partial [Candidatus Puniceispirillaceae bacterium]
MMIHPIDDANLDRAATCLKDGGLVAFPTETVYGLGALATDATAVARIFSAKQRPRFNPLISHFHAAEAALAAGCPNEASRQLAKAFWPGPLTLILSRPENSPIAALASAGTDTLAVRVPLHPAALDLLERVGA